jgi:methyl-accepting chemotaxis protein
MPNLNPKAFIPKGLRAWSNGVVKRFKGDGSAGNGRLNALPELGIELAALGRSTEKEFLSVGEKLQSFHGLAEEIAQLSASVARLLSGEGISAAINGFREVMDRMRGLEGESRQNTTLLANVLEILNRLDHQLRSFFETARSLRVLCVSTKIESARLGERDIGFNALAGEVGNLALLIEEKTAHLLARSESLNDLIGRALLRVTEIEARQHLQAGLILDKTMSNLGSLQEKHALSSAAAKQISTRYEAVSWSIGEIVTSMQFHDITRQRMEHVKKALDSIVCARPNSGRTRRAKDVGADQRLFFGLSEKSGRAPMNGNPFRMAGEICAIQAAQLQDARDQLVSAVENIIENLVRVADQVVMMSQETERMASAANQTEQSFLSKVEEGFDAVIAELSSYDVSSRELATVMDSVGDTLREMSIYTDDIEGIGAKIRRIALNAIVKASQLGDAGATLDVLAEAVHSLSIEACRRTETAGEALRSIVSASESLHTGIRNDGEDRGDAGVTRMGETLKTLLGGLKDVNRNMVSLLDRMNEGAHLLSEGTRKTIAEVNVHHRVDDVVERALDQLDEIVSDCRRHDPIAGRSDPAELTKGLETFYSMQGERQVHQSAVSATGAVVRKPGSNPCVPSNVSGMKGEKPEESPENDPAADMGENVELF